MSNRGKNWRQNRNGGMEDLNELRQVLMIVQKLKELDIEQATSVYKSMCITARGEDELHREEEVLIKLNATKAAEPDDKPEIKELEELKIVHRVLEKEKYTLQKNVEENEQKVLQLERELETLKTEATLPGSNFVDRLNSDTNGHNELDSINKGQNGSDFTDGRTVDGQDGIPSDRYDHGKLGSEGVSFSGHAVDRSSEDLEREVQNLRQELQRKDDIISRKEREVDNSERDEDRANRRSRDEVDRKERDVRDLERDLNDAKRTIREKEDELNRVEREKNDLDSRERGEWTDDDGIRSRDRRIEELENELRSVQKRVDVKSETANPSYAENDSLVTGKVNPKLKKNEHIEDDRPVAEDEGISEPETELAKLKVDLKKKDEELQTIEKEKQAAIERLNQIEKDLGLDFNEDEQSDDRVQTSLSQKYTDLYEHEWKQAMRKLTSVGEDRSVRVLLDAVKTCYEWCDDIADKQMESLQITLSNPMTHAWRSNSITSSETTLKCLQHARLLSAKTTIPNLYKEFMTNNKKSRFYDVVPEYIQKCIEVCWGMVIQDPPFVMGEEAQLNKQFDAEYYTSNSDQGTIVKYTLWLPLMQNEEGNDLLNKGIIQPKTKHSRQQRERANERSSLKKSKHSDLTRRDEFSYSRSSTADVSMTPRNYRMEYVGMRTQTSSDITGNLTFEDDDNISIASDMSEDQSLITHGRNRPQYSQPKSHSVDFGSSSTRLYERGEYLSPRRPMSARQPNYNQEMYMQKVPAREKKNRYEQKITEKSSFGNYVTYRLIIGQNHEFFAEYDGATHDLEEFKEIMGLNLG